jgi:hypothetical protein
MSTEKEFVPYKQSLELKNLGFDGLTNAWRQHGEGVYGDVIGRYDYYNRKGDLYTALPTFSQAFRFFRQKHNLYGFITPAEKKDTKLRFSFHIVDNWDVNEIFDTYKEAELACLNRLIEIVKSKKD